MVQDDDFPRRSGGSQLTLQPGLLRGAIKGERAITIVPGTDDKAYTLAGEQIGNLTLGS